MASKVDLSNVIDVKYDDIPEEDRKAFEAKLKQQQEEAMKNLLSCHGRTQNEVVKKAEFFRAIVRIYFLFNQCKHSPQRNV